MTEIDTLYVSLLNEYEEEVSWKGYERIAIRIDHALQAGRVIFQWYVPEAVKAGSIGGLGVHKLPVGDKPFLQHPSPEQSPDMLPGSYIALILVFERSFYDNEENVRKAVTTDPYAEANRLLGDVIGKDRLL